MCAPTFPFFFFHFSPLSHDMFDAQIQWIAETLAPVAIGGPFPSVSLSMLDDAEVSQFHEQFLGRHELPGRVMACFGENWNRLCEVKQTYDPSNFFRHSLWPLNAKGDIIPPEEHEPEHVQF